MKKLWAPWRFEYICSTQKGCFFCKSLKSKNPAKALLLRKDKYAFIIMNLYPYNNGHIMIAPRRHVGYYEKLKSYELDAMNKLLTQALKAMKTAMRPQGFNIGINQGAVAGAGVIDHIHIHCVPRWQGDTNYMPVLADTKIVSDSLKNTYTLLLQALNKIKT